MVVAFSRFAPQPCPFGGPCQWELYRATRDPWNDPPYLPPPYTPLLEDADIVVTDLMADARLRRAENIVRQRSRATQASMSSPPVPERWSGTVISHSI